MQRKGFERDCRTSGINHVNRNRSRLVLPNRDGEHIRAPTTQGEIMKTTHQPQISPDNPNDPRWHWAAGIYEGEGTIGLGGWNKGFDRSVYISITQKDRWLLHKLKSVFGGSVGKPRKTDGCSGWYLFSESARVFIRKIYPLLSPRRQKQIRKRMKVLA